MTDCACVYIAEYGTSDFYNEKMVKARKKHFCHECGKVIQINEEYEYVAGLWDGDFNTYKTCYICLDIRRVFFCYGWIYGQLYEDLHEHIADFNGEISGDCLTELDPDSKTVVLEMIEKYWDEE